MNNRTACLLTLGFLSLSLTFGPGGQAVASEGESDSEGLLFADDFSSGDLSSHNDQFRWGRSGAIPGEGASSSRIDEVEGPDGDLIHALRFQYEGGASGDAGRWSEQRFHLTESVEEERTESGPSDVAHREIWISFWMKIPANYHHQLTNDTVPGANHKGWVHLWNRNYATSQHAEGRRPPVMLRWEWWPTTGAEAGKSVVSWMVRGGSPHTNPTWVREDHRVPGSSRGFAWLESDYGQWVHFAFRTRVSSGPDVDDALMQVYKDGELVQEKADFVAFPPHEDDHHLAGFDRGYLMGYHNAGYAETTTYHLADFKVGTTGESVGVTPASP